LAIRPATAADAPAIKALIDSYVAGGTLLPRSEAFIEAHAHDFLVATVDGGGGGGGRRVVGCVHLDDYAPSLAEVRSLAVDPGHQGGGIGVALVEALERLARIRGYATLFAVSNNGAFFLRQGYVERDVPELNRERSEVSRFKGVYAKDLTPAID
jgi:amino-acid N-acetyltransferase